MPTILEDIAKRQSRLSGIGLASDYVSTIGQCFGRDGAEKYFGMGTAGQWLKALKDSQEKLVYREGAKAFECKDKKESGLIPGACMEFNCVLTSKRRDRDCDILEPAGASVDESMPLLWQHIPMEPIGKFLEIISRDDEKVVVRCAIADTQFGRDVAQLVAFGALRISHGFVPTKFEPLDDGDQKGSVGGWHVLEYDVLEVSTVSVPSNTDAVITSFSREKLHHPLVKSWARAAFEARPTIVRGAEMSQQQPVEVHVHLDSSVVKGKKEEQEVVEEPKQEVSEMASIGRVHLLLEQALKVDGLPDAAVSLIEQAVGELEAAISEESEEEVVEESDESEEASSEEDESKEGEDEDKEDDESKEGEDEDKEDDEEDEEKSYCVADDLFKAALKKYRKSGVKLSK